MAEPKADRPAEVETLGLEPLGAPTVEERPAGAGWGVRLAVVSRDRYAVEGEHARGGMGRILRARDRRLGRVVALKELRPDAAEGGPRFVREALVTARLQHPSIVPIYEAGLWPEGSPFYAMKLVEGRSLEALLRECPSLGARLALLPHLIAVAEAIAYAHREGVVHRDLKPANVLVGPFGETVVVDWGLAKDLRGPGSEEKADGRATAGSPGSTVVGSVMGTPRYMAPEQARGEPVDERADVWALGAILYYLLAGNPPWSGKSAAEAIAAAVAEPPPPVEAKEPDAPRDLLAIVRKAMAPVPADRYPSAQELAIDLRRFQTGQLVSVQHYSTLELLRRWVSRHRAVVAVASVLTLALAVSIVAGFVSTKRQARLAELQRDVARREAAKAERINDFVLGMLGSADPRVEGRAVTVAAVLDAAARRAETELAAEPEIQASVRRTLGTTYEGLGLYEPAERLLKSALETRRRVLGSDHEEVAGSLRDLATLESTKGDLAAAETLCREALAIFDRRGLSGSQEAVETWGELASVLEGLGRTDEAERLHRETLAKKRALVPPDELSIATSLNNLGVLLGQKGRWAEAAPLHREAVEIVRRHHGGDHPDVANALGSLASALAETGDVAGASAAFRETLALRTRLLGERHPDVAWTLYNYAFFLRDKGKPEESARLIRRVLALRGDTLPEGHPLVPGALQVLGLCLLDLGRPQEALAPLRESLALRRLALPSGHWLVASSESVLGDCLTRLGRYREADRLLRSAYRTLLASRGEEHARTKEACRRLEALDAARGGPAKAPRCLS
jgi:tetratricopeptide (TPR) repeat protein